MIVIKLKPLLVILFSSATLIEPQKVFFNIYSHKLSWHNVVISSGASAINYMVSKFEMGNIHSRVTSGGCPPLRNLLTF